MPQTLIAQFQLRPDAEQAAALEATLRQANAAAGVLSTLAWEHRAFRRYDPHHLAYHEIRESSGLTAQVVISAGSLRDVNGAPPSGSPAHRSSRGWAAAAAPTVKAMASARNRRGATGDDSTGRAPACRYFATA